MGRRAAHKPGSFNPQPSTDELQMTAQDSVRPRRDPSTETQVRGSPRIGRAKNSPQPYFPNTFHLNGGCVVDIHLSSEAWRERDYFRGGWQVAHESVHLLDPGERTTNVLEEGLATWFQCNPKYHNNIVREYIAIHGANSLLKDSRNYMEARKLVCSIMPLLLDSIKQIRAFGIRIRDITPERLARSLPNAHRQTLETLCSKFQE